MDAAIRRIAARSRQGVLTGGLAVLLAGCSGMYYAAIEKLGWESHDILVNRVEIARDCQAAARRQFDRLVSLVRDLVTDDSETPARTDALRVAYADAESRAREVRTRVAKVASAGTAAFDERRLSDAKIRDDAARERASQRTAQAEARYAEMLTTMRQAAAATGPALAAVQATLASLGPRPSDDAVGALRDAVTEVDATVTALVRDLDQAIAEADAFVQRSVSAG
jgi:predicted  nucleic acid-binding Zn-ribbon protein